MTQKPSMKFYIANTFEELLEQKSFDNISVNEIVEKCEISRTTFYHHFKDKYDLVAWIYKQEAEKIKSRNSESGSWKTLVLDFMNLTIQKKKYFKIALNYYEQNSLLDIIHECGYLYIKEIITKELNTDILPKSIDFSAKMYSYSTAYMQKEWLLNGTKESPEEIANLLCENIPLPLQPYFKM